MSLHGKTARFSAVKTKHQVSRIGEYRSGNTNVGILLGTEIGDVSPIMGIGMGIIRWEWNWHILCV